MGAIRTTPTKALEIIVGLEPLIIFIKQEAMLACCRMKVNSQWAHTLCGHTKIDNQLATNVPLSKMRCDKTSPKYVFHKNYTVFLRSRDNWLTQNVRLTNDIICWGGKAVAMRKSWFKTPAR